MREIRRVVVHCSDSAWGDASVIESWHKKRGWAGIGYHYVVLNGRRDAGAFYVEDDDGKIERGRDEDAEGAHVFGHNSDTIGVCMIGRDGLFTVPQLSHMLILVSDIIHRYELTISDVCGHRDLDERKKKTCPGFNTSYLRFLLRSVGGLNPEPVIDPI